MSNLNYDEYALYQVDEILKNLEPAIRSKIPKKYIEFFHNNKAKNYNWKWDSEKTLKEQDLLPKTKSILTVLYSDFICEEDERKKINGILLKNEMEYQKEAKAKYSPEIVLKNRNQRLNNYKQEKVVEEKKNDRLLKKLIKKFI